MLQFNCPRCGSMIPVLEKHRGKKGQCKNCNGELIVPQADENEDQFLRDCLSDTYSTEKAIQERQDKAAANTRELERNSSPNLVVTGIGGRTVSLRGSSICIRRPGTLMFDETEKLISIRQIAAIEVTPRYLRVILSNSHPNKFKFSLDAGLSDALLKDEHAIVFNGPKDYKKALRLQQFVAEYGEKPARSAPMPPTERSIADQIRELKTMLDDGLITDAEFQAKKKQILGI